MALISALTGADLSPEAHEEIGEHVARCASCVDAEASLEEALSLYRSQDTVSIPAQLEKRLLDCLCGQKALGGQDERDEPAAFIRKSTSIGGDTK